ncbi:MAG TPA: FKBP-type peptidyl-prolyl cis-trans isomerase [Capillimicrobium sp.]|nr:FKBP-type peptidyl-prolyl cis-trans isomerase [Capillimicrobium sp.]
MLLSLAALALVGAGCGSDDSSDESATTGTQAATTEQSAAGAEFAFPDVGDDLKAKPEIGEITGAAPTRLQTKDIVEGTGPTAKKGDVVSVDYVGVLYDDGQQFDASWDRGEPIEFQLGVGQVIPGWDQGIEGMKVGGRRLLVIPPDLAYGEQGAPPAIPPNATLIFVADLKKVRG